MGLYREIPKLSAETLILASDFNSAPWGGRFRHFMQVTGLHRHGTWGRSWPAHLGIAGPQIVLIDNVVTTRDVRAISFATGPALGSDHLPVVARQALP